MAAAPKTNPYRLIALIGLSDMILGVALAVMTLTGTLDLDRTITPVIGGVLALAGGVVFVWAREKAAAFGDGV